MAKEKSKESKKPKELKELTEGIEEADFTKYEKARMVGSRALQLSMGAPFLVKLSEEDLAKINFNPIEIALKEYAEGVLPITVKRPSS